MILVYIIHMEIRSGLPLEGFNIQDDRQCADLAAQMLLMQEMGVGESDTPIDPPTPTLEIATEAIEVFPGPPPVEPDLETIEPQRQEVARNKSVLLKRYIGFTVVRQAANIEWAGGIAAGELAIQEYGVNRWLAASAVAGVVALSEYKQSKWLDTKIQKSGEKPQNDKDIVESSKELIDYIKSSKTESLSSKVKGVAKKVLPILSAVYKEVSALASASWQGAAATVEINHAHGLKSSDLRIKVQSGVYGGFVGMWLTPVPPFAQLRGYAKDAFDYIVENPLQSTAAGAALSVGIFGLINGYKAAKNKILQIRQNKKAPFDAEPV